MGKILTQFNVDFTQNRVVFTQINAKIIRIGAETLDFGFEMDCRARKFAPIDCIFCFFVADLVLSAIDFTDRRPAISRFVVKFFSFGLGSAEPGTKTFAFYDNFSRIALKILGNSTDRIDICSESSGPTTQK